MSKSPHVTNAKLKNKRTKFVQKLNKERQADVGFGSSQTLMIKNIFTVVLTLVKMLGSMAHNVQGLAIVAEIVFRQADNKSRIINKKMKLKVIVE